MLSRLPWRCGVGLVSTLFVAFLTIPSVFAQGNTGKIQGRVIDAQTGQPIGGAQVSVLGTGRGNISNADGYYFINEVPAGLQTVAAEFIGYRTTRVENERVLAGQTITLNFDLEPAAIEVEPLVFEGERNPLVPRDQVSSKKIVTGELIDRLPIDNAQSIALLLPGVINTNQGVTIRGSRPNEQATYLDGVLTRRYSSGNAAPIELPANALAQVDVTTGGFGARFGEAQSGVVNVVTKSGGTDYQGSVSYFTDQAGPKSWRTGFNRLEATFGGPTAREANLSFFVAGVAEGRKYTPLNDGYNDVPILVPSGVDTVIRVARSSNAANAADSLDVPFPNFVEWDNGPTAPYTPDDEYTFLGKLSWGFGGGSSLDFSYKREREQDIQLGILDPIFPSELYNPDGFDGAFSTADILTLGGYFLVTQSAEQAVALDVKASYQRYYDQDGELDSEWLADHRDPWLGFNISSMKFMVDSDDWPVTRELIEAVRSGVMPAESLQVFPGREDLDGKQSLPGLDSNLRLNPYGLRRNFEISGFRNGGLEFQREKDWIFSAALDWQMGRYYRLQAGGDLAKIDTRRQRVPLFRGTAIPALNEPTRLGLFISNRLDIGDVVIDAGLRWDRFDPDGDFPRVPGYVFNVPDSLKADFVRVTAGDGPILDRLEPLGSDPVEGCGGAATAANRTNPGADGILGNEDDFLVCKDNFIEAETKSEISPRLGVSFPVTSKSTFRLSYSHNVQVPALHQQGFGALFAAQGVVGLFSDQYADLQGGLANTNTEYGRDVELPRTVLFEAGYRQLIGEDLVVDVAAYSKTLRNGLTFRKLEFEDPNVPGQAVFLNVLTNADYAQTRGIDLRLDKRFGQIADVSLNYSFVDARGTGSDPFTYTELLLRRNTNLSVITGEPVIPPDVMLPLEQSRTHNIAGTLSLLFPPDYQEGTALGSILSDVGLFATLRLASGLPFTRLENSANGQTGPPTDAGLGGIPAEELNASHMPWEKRFDLRVTKGFEIGPTRVRWFADWRNPFNLTNLDAVYLETGTVRNEAYKEKLLNQQLADPLLDDDPAIDGFNIAQESPENPFNKYALMQAEVRYGDGDGFFSVEEQRAAFGAWYDLIYGPQRLRESNQRIRLGFEVLF